MAHNPLRSKQIVFDDGGYALTSVLFLITILSLVVLSILAVKYFQRQLAQREITRVKADYAAQNSISSFIAEMNVKSGLPRYGQTVSREYHWEDGEEGRLAVGWWGFYLLACAEGTSGNIREKRTALLGERPLGAMENALVFANTNHQLVLTGFTTIRGDVVIGPAGVSIGTMKDYSTPRKVPIEGRIKRTAQIALPAIDIKEILDYFDSRLLGKAPEGTDPAACDFIRSDSEVRLSNGTVSPSRRYIFIRGNVLIDSAIVRRDVPLTIAVDGYVRFAANAKVKGLICIASTQTIEIGQNVAFDEGILYSTREVRLLPGSGITAQLIAPAIEIASQARVSYPSVLLSYVGRDQRRNDKGIIINNGAYVEGSVVGITEDDSGTQTVVKIESGARIRGFVLAYGSITLDGSVAGCVIAKDFYCYESPTTYLGWLRSARIDRIQCPQTMLTVPLSDSLSLAVQDWL